MVRSNRPLFRCEDDSDHLLTTYPLGHKVSNSVLDAVNNRYFWSTMSHRWSTWSFLNLFAINDVAPISIATSLHWIDSTFLHLILLLFWNSSVLRRVRRVLICRFSLSSLLFSFFFLISCFMRISCLSCLLGDFNIALILFITLLFCLILRQIGLPNRQRYLYCFRLVCSCIVFADWISVWVYLVLSNFCSFLFLLYDYLLFTLR